MRIICATDFSPNASAAGQVAAALAARQHETLVLAHVTNQLEPSVSRNGDPDDYSSPIHHALTREAECLRSTGALIQERMLFGPHPAQTVLEFARQRPTRLLVVSSVSKNAVERWTLGSVAEAIAENAPCPTLIVRTAAPLTGWVESRRRLKIFAAIDSSTSCEAAIYWLGELRRIGPCDIVAGHVSRPPEEERLPGIGASRAQAAVAEHPETLQRDLTKKIDLLLGPNDVRVMIQPAWGQPETALVEMAKAVAADLFVIGTHQWQGLNRVWHGSVSREVLRRAPMNVACVPTMAPEDRVESRLPAFDRVLVTTDFSSLGNRAVAFAYSAVSPGGTVKLIHVGETELPFEARRHLRALIPPAAESRRITTEIEVIPGGDIGPAICQTAERIGADLICLGSHGRTGLKGAVLGSVAQAVLNQSRKPLLLVRPPEE